MIAAAAARTSAALSRRPMDDPALVERRSSSPAPSDVEAQTDYAPLMEDGGQSQGDSTRSGPVHTAVLLAIGSELTSGETRDTNGGDLARSQLAADCQQ